MQRNGRDDISLDRLSSLPIEILIHILSTLTVHEAIKTSILSRQWRYLWRHIPFLSFVYPLPHHINQHPDDFLNFVGRSLDLHMAQCIQSLSVSFNYNEHDSNQVDSWIHHAVQHNAHELAIDLWANKLRFKEPYELPPCFFNFASLEVLRMSSFRLHAPFSSRLSSLRTVALNLVTVAPDAIKNLTSASPCLESLTFDDCYGIDHDLNIHSVSPKLRSVVVRNIRVPAPDTTIYAPNLSQLTLCGSAVYRRFQIIKGLPLLYSLVLSFEKLFNTLFWGKYEEAHGDWLIELLKSLCHVIKLELCSWCVQVLATRAVTGVVKCSSDLKLDVKSLELNIGLHKWELPGIAYLLKGCHQLQVLDIKFGAHKGYKLSSDCLEKYDFNERQYWKDSSCIIEHLLIVRISGFMGQAYLRAKENNTNVEEEVLETVQNEVEFIKFLLKSSVALEKITISSTIEDSDFSHLLENSESLLEVVQELLVFPKASPKAEMTLIRN